MLGRLIVAVSMTSDMASLGQRTSWESLFAPDIVLSVLLRNIRDALIIRQNKAASSVGGSSQAYGLVLLWGVYLLIFVPRIGFP